MAFRKGSKGKGGTDGLARPAAWGVVKKHVVRRLSVARQSTSTHPPSRHASSIPLPPFTVPAMSHTTSTSAVATNGNGAMVGGHFQVGKKLGEGSFGVVFEGPALPSCYAISIHKLTGIFYSILGINTLNGQPVAIKFVSCSASSIGKK